MIHPLEIKAVIQPFRWDFLWEVVKRFASKLPSASHVLFISIQVPTAIVPQNARIKKMLSALRSDRDVQRLAGFQSGNVTLSVIICYVIDPSPSESLRVWAPRLFTHYESYLAQLITHHPNLTRNFAKSVFAAITFNLGPQTCTHPHRDTHNLAYGWCAVTALGQYDAKRGGHLVLSDLKLAIEFPPGSTILLPSAVLEHSNTAVSVHETRFSITQYSAGQLFQWVDHGFQSLKDLRAQISDYELLEDIRKDSLGRKDLLPTFEELSNDTESSRD